MGNGWEVVCMAQFKSAGICLASHFYSVELEDINGSESYHFNQLRMSGSTETFHPLYRGSIKWCQDASSGSNPLFRSLN